MRSTYSRPAMALLALALLLAACGGSDDDDAKDVATAAPQPSTAAVASTAAPTSAAAAATATPTGPQVVEVTEGEEGSAFYLRPGEVTVRPGAVTIKMTNMGPMRPHNVVVRTKAGDADLAKSANAEAGQSITLEFSVTEPGSYELYCSLPGHKDRGAKGTLIVQPS